MKTDASLRSNTDNKRFYIGIEDLAANALIELLQKNSKHSFITYDVIEAYGNRVLKVLSSKGDKAVLILSRDSTEAMFRNYSDYFEEKEYDGKLGIKLNNEKNLDDLIMQFRGYLDIDVLKAFMDEESIEVLGA